jgi:acetoacetyl-CoA synthetase
MPANAVIWTPDDEQAQATAMHRFLAAQGFRDYASLHRWSITEPAAFWQALTDFCAVRFERPPSSIIAHPDDIMHAGWFTGARLNYAEHLLRFRGSEEALIFCGEDGARRAMSRDELRRDVACVSAALRRAGVVAGDRVGGYLPNCPEAIVAMLATASLGATWSSCSPDFGANGVIERFGQIGPKVLFAANGYLYNDKRIDCLANTAAVVAAIPEISHTVIVPFLDSNTALPGGARSVEWQDFTAPAAEPEFVPVAFDHPLFILFSSGTTGVPKCIVHGHGGTLLQHLKEHVLHTDVRPGDRLFYFTTCGWMMWNWLASGLAAGATLVLFDGSPFFGDGRGLWSIAARERIGIFGTSAKYLAALEKAGVCPRQAFDMPALRVLLSTGSPLAPSGFDYVYSAIGNDLQLASIAGGTDIISCFLLGNPLLPVRRGELQCKGLGMAVEIFDETGRPVVGKQGELVCTRPFPSAPVGFWNDPGDVRYRAAYFERFPGVWAHGDFAEEREESGFVIYGRSDAVLNPGGVRIGTAEIYRQVEKLDEVEESLAIGQRWRHDVRIVLFVVLREGLSLDDALQARIRDVVRRNTTPRHVPAKILAVPALPRTKSGKLVEIAVRSVVHGEDIRNREALANPDALEYFRNIPELAGE